MKTLAELLRRFGVLFAAGALCAGFVLSSWKVQTTYNVAVTTEIVEFDTSPETDVAWTLPYQPDSLAIAEPGLDGVEGWKGFADIDDPENGESFLAFAGRLQFRGGCHVKIERMLEGPLQVYIENPTGASVGELSTPDEQFVAKLGSEVVLELPRLAQVLAENRSLLLPIHGEIFVGQEIGVTAETSNPILLSGELTLVDHSRFGERFFQIDSFDLGPGDSLTVERSNGENQPSEGFVRIAQDPAMTVIFRTVAWRARVQRYGGRRFLISAGLRDTFLNNPYVNTVTSSFMTIILFVGGWLAARKDESRPDSKKE